MDKKILIVLPPSDSLIMNRKDVLKSSLICPSGAQLVWEEILIEHDERSSCN